MTQRRRVLAAPILCVLLIAAGCGQKRDAKVEHPELDPETAARLGLSPDAVDPTERDRLAGYNRWNAKPEPEGTASPLSPARRRLDRRD